MCADRSRNGSQSYSPRHSRRRREWLVAGAAGLASIALGHSAWAADLSQTIAAIKPSVVAIASYQKLRSPATVFFGTGFVVGDGLTIITNAHVVTASINVDKVESLGVLIGTDGAAEFRPAILIDSDPEHDLARLRIGGTPLPALRLGDSAGLLEGQGVAFTGFPLGMALGLTKVTHRGMISAITPVIRPAMNSSRLDPKSIAQLQKSAYSVFQLDGTAYPGNSGSPLYDPETGVVFGIINMVFIKGLKETAITNPSGITYAIPGNYIRSFLDQKH
jgi:serine protease Do